MALVHEHDGVALDDKVPLALGIGNRIGELLDIEEHRIVLVRGLLGQDVLDIRIVRGCSGPLELLELQSLLQGIAQHEARRPLDVAGGLDGASVLGVAVAVRIPQDQTVELEAVVEAGHHAAGDGILKNEADLPLTEQGAVERGDEVLTVLVDEGTGIVQGDEPPLDVAGDLIDRLVVEEGEPRLYGPLGIESGGFAEVDRAAPVHPVEIRDERQIEPFEGIPPACRWHEQLVPVEGPADELTLS